MWFELEILLLHHKTYATTLKTLFKNMEPKKTYIIMGRKLMVLQLPRAGPDATSKLETNLAFVFFFFCLSALYLDIYPQPLPLHFVCANKQNLVIGQ